MAMTNQQQTDAYRFFVIAFGATPGVEYMNQLDEAYSFGLTTQEIVNIYTLKPQFTSKYPAFFSSEQFANALIQNVIGNSASDSAKAEAKADIIGALNANFSRGDIIYQIFTNLAAKDPADPVWGKLSVTLANKVAVSKFATEELLNQDANESILNSVTFNPASVEAAKQTLQGNGSTGNETISLTVGMDDLSGTGGTNTFKAVVGQNSQGLMANTLGSGDKLDGLGGTDTLMAKVTSGMSADGNSWSMPISPETTSIEIVKFEAVLADVNFGDFSGRDEVFINAKDMTDVQQLWSNHSDADLTVMNLTTKGLEKLSDMTIGMAYTGNADSRWNESDMHVYFDQDYLTPEATRTKPTVDFLAMNEDAYDFTDAAFPLAGVFFRELKFTLNGTKFDLKQYLNEDPLGSGEEITTYTGFLAAVQAALVELKAANPTNDALQSVQASFGQQFKTDVNPITLEQREGTGIRLTVDGLTNGAANNLSVVSTDLEVARAAAAVVPNNNRYEIADNTPPTAGEKLGINVALEKVGLAGDGGELVIGSMNKMPGNTWDAVNTVVEGTTSGIEEFYVTVYGNNTKSSSLAGLHSTNNNLRVVTVDSDAAQTGTFANLTIGNSHTDIDGFEGYENALKDVQTFNASGFKGDLTLFAGLTAEITDKYLNLEDAAPGAPGADNLNFEYTGGTGNDNINLTISADNGAFSGAANREDFLMNSTLNGGDGNDMLTLAIVGRGSNNFFDSTDSMGLAIGQGANAPGFANWYDNQKLNANLRIDGGNGNDTIKTPGSGDVIIDGGAGNDTVYADNTGDKAVWAFNYASGVASRAQLSNLQSDANDKYNVYKTDVKVNFLGFEATARIPDVKGVASDLDINQAIKKAINSDPVLSKLLEAKDGPGNTLVVTSLIDGVRANVADLAVTLVPPTVANITPGDALVLANFYSMPGLTPAGAVAAITAQTTLFNTNAAGMYNQGFALQGLNAGSEFDGSNSVHTSDNTITGGVGNDVLVLGTGAESNDKVKYVGFGNGTDTIVNFSDAGTTTTTVNAATVAIVTQGTAGTPAGTPVSEVFTLNVTGSAAAVPGTISFDDGYFGVAAADIVPAAGASAATVAAAMAASITLGGIWTATSSGGVVTVTALAGGAAADVTVSNAAPAFINYNGSGVGITSNVVTQGAAAAPAVAAATEVFSVTFANADQAGTYTFGGKSVTVLAGETGANIAAAFASAGVTGWTAVNVPDTNVVTFTSTTPNASVVDVTAADFVGTNTVVTTVGLTAGFDMLDFSAYNAKAVLVDGVQIAGTAAVLNETYITLVESATNDGVYTITQYKEMGAVDTVVGVIGVADFGSEQTFAAGNFVL